MSDGEEERKMRVALRKIDEEIEKRVNEKLERIKRIKFFKPERTLEEANSIVPKVDEIIDNYMNALRPYKRENMRWEDAEEAAEHVAKEAAKSAGRKAILDLVAEKAEDIAKGEASVGMIGWDFATYSHIFPYVGWEVVRDLPGFEKNPFDYVIQLYEIGLMPAYFLDVKEEDGFGNVDVEERYVVDFPLNINGNRVLGCYAHRDGEILWVHEWEDEWEDLCASLKPLKFRLRKIECE